MLDEWSVVPYLAEQGVLDRPDRATVRALTGGVSSIVLAVHTPERAIIVKQALPFLRVEQEWPADRYRTAIEAAGLALAARLTPAAVPAVVHFDPERLAVVLEAAPADWQPWKPILLAGRADPATAATVGDVAGTWHAATLHDPEVEQRFGDRAGFVELRVDPFYRTVARCRPELAPAMTSFADQLAERACCFVHGDLSPKNVLVGTGGLWLVDFEVAHWGDPAFDVAFLLTHLALKTVHAAPEDRPRLRACAVAFWDAYESAAPAGLTEPPYALGQTACLLAARVDGKSRAEYLDEGERRRVRRLAHDLLAAPPATVADAWRVVEAS